jgi:hypothetical protein
MSSKYNVITLITQKIAQKILILVTVSDNNSVIALEPFMLWV